MITLLTALLIGVTNMVDFVTAENLYMAATYRLEAISMSTTGAVHQLNAEDIISDIERRDMMEEVVKKLAKDGHICAVLGHQWKNDIINTTYAVYVPPDAPITWWRKCSICGKRESKTEGEWK